jgi:hypothetical protein
MLDAYKDLIDELLETPRAIREAIADSSGPLEETRVAKEVSNLRDHDLRVLDHARTMMQRENAYIEDVLPMGVQGELTSLDEALGELDTARGDLVSLLINLSLKDWERTAVLKSGGEVTLSDMVEDHVEFDEAARARVQELLRIG